MVKSIGKSLVVQFPHLLIVFLIIGLGFSIVIGGNPEIERVRVLFFWRVVEVLTLLVSLKIVFFSQKTNLNLGLSWLLLGLLSIGLLSSILGVNVHQSLWGNFFRRDGVLTLIHYLLFSLVVGVSWSDKLEEWITRSVASVIVLISIYLIVWNCMYAFSIWYAPQLQLLLSGVLILPNLNMIAGFLTVAVPIAVPVFVKISARKWGVVGLLGLVFLAILLTQSWGAILTLAVGVAVYLLKNTPQKYLLLPGLILALTLGVGIYIWQLSATNLTEGRIVLFRSLLVAAAERPLLGWGWSNVDVAFESGYMKIFGSSSEVYVDKAHSIWLEYIVTTGIVGFVVYISLQIKCFFILWHTKFDKKKVMTSALLFSLLLYCIHSQTNVISITEDLFFWIIVGFCLQKVPQQA